MNKAMIIGNLGQDPEVRYTRNGTPVATFPVATTERWKDAEGNRQEHTEWHRAVAWRGLAETCRDHLNKGDKVYLCGKLKTRKWEDQHGIARYTTELIVNELEMLGGKRDTGTPPESGAPPVGDGDVPF